MQISRTVSFFDYTVPCKETNELYVSARRLSNMSVIAIIESSAYERIRGSNGDKRESENLYSPAIG